jgi:hypothetical protein
MISVTSPDIHPTVNSMNIIATGTLPKCPTVNRAYQSVPIYKNGIFVRSGFATTPEIKRWKADAALLLPSQCSYDLTDVTRIQKNLKHKAKGKAAPIYTPLYLEVNQHMHNVFLDGDEDGPIKFIQDAIFKHLGLKDNCVLEFYTKKRPLLASDENPYIRFALYEILEGEITSQS